MKDLMTVVSNASDRVVPRICAKVKRIVPNAPMTQMTAEILSNRRSFSPEVERYPSLLTRRKAIAKSEPMTEIPPTRLRNLKLVARRFIDW
jgi:hypothetical protein